MNTIFHKEYDVIICGGGIAGIAAALEAKRKGLNTALIEKTVFPGGLATAGLINIFLPLCDGKGNQILFGLPEELLKLSIQYSPFSIPDGWGGKTGTKKSRYIAQYSPASFVLALDKILEEENINLWYDTLVCDVKMKDNTVNGVYVENKSGRGLLSAKCIIDATGDADIAYKAGAELKTGTNKLSYWAINASNDKMASSLKYDDTELLLNILHLNADDTKKEVQEITKKITGINGAIVSKFIIQSRKLLRKHYEELKERNKKDYPLALPAIPQFRTTRRIIGEESVLNKNCNKDIENSIATIPDWRKAGNLWQIPAGALVPKNIKGLLVAGRIISAEEGDAWNVCRVIPVAAMTGSLAGKQAFKIIKKQNKL